MSAARAASSGGNGWTASLAWNRTTIACLLTVAAMVLGGGGSGASETELALQLIAALACAAWIALPPLAPAVPLSRAVLALGALVLALPLVQLVPLPPVLWQALPGRANEVASLALVGAADRWMPWSMTPARTLASLLATVPPVIAMAMASRLDGRGRDALLATIVVVAFASVLLGAMQLASGATGGWQLYSPAHVGYLIGFQANRNAQADVLLIALLAQVALLSGARPRLGGRAAGVVALGGTLVLALACVLTGSRMGIALLPVALAGGVAIWHPRLVGGRAAGLALGGLVAGGLVAWLALRDNHALGRILSRFSQERDFRFELWEDTRYAIAAHWPFGSGMGSFRPVFIAAERLEVIDPSYPVRAHNDFLEILLEGGLFGAALLLGTIAVIGTVTVRAWRARSGGTRPQVLFGALALGIVAMHSGVDYPLRSMALAHLAAVAAGILAAYAQGRTSRDEKERPQS